MKLSCSSMICFVPALLWAQKIAATRPALTRMPGARNLDGLIEDPSGEMKTSFFRDDGIVEKIGDKVGDFMSDGVLDWDLGIEDENGDGIPDILPEWPSFGENPLEDWEFEMPDWASLDWLNFDFQDFDWEDITWSREKWENFVETLLQNGRDNLDIDICPILETAVGLGQDFGIKGDCKCAGSIGSSLSIQCGFEEECLPGSTVCGDVSVGIAIDDTTGSVSTDVCADVTNDGYEEICFSYTVGVADMFSMDQSCSASYGGNECKCDIDGLCLSIDCEAYLPGASIDTCQKLAFDTGDDAVSLIPRFQIFEDNFTKLKYDEVRWPQIDWENLDWNNFGLADVDWSMEDIGAITWGSIFNPDTEEDQVCTVLTRFMELNDKIAQACSCQGDLESGFDMGCSFQDECIPGSSICGSAALWFSFTNVGVVEGSLCVDFDGDIHPRTCIEYEIPLLGQDERPVCTASYGPDQCSCEIDTLCVEVDCSMYEPTAVMDTCQFLSLDGFEDVINLIPDFGIPTSPENIPDIPDTINDPSEEAAEEEEDSQSGSDVGQEGENVDLSPEVAETLLSPANEEDNTVEIPAVVENDQTSPDTVQVTEELSNTEGEELNSACTKQPLSFLHGITVVLVGMLTTCV